MQSTTQNLNNVFDLQASPTDTGSLTRSISCCQHPTDKEVRPLLSTLSPASTLEALVSTNVVDATGNSSAVFVKVSVADSSEAERAWGIKAALAGKRIIEWHDELQEWPWSDGKGALTNGFQETRDGRLLQQYQERVEIIRNDMETLGVEELKVYVRDAHVKTMTCETDTSNHDHLDDFTAIITATIVQSLPTLSRLNVLLGVWSIRLIVLRLLPALLAEMKNCQESILSAWIAIGQADNSDMKPKPEFSRTTSAEVRAVLQDQITQLGRKVDVLLDLLEGSQDTLPDEWIDTMDQLENEYSSWVVRADELVLNNEMESAFRGQEEDDSVHELNLRKAKGHFGSVDVNFLRRKPSNVDGAADLWSSAALPHRLPIAEDQNTGREPLSDTDEPTSCGAAPTSSSPERSQVQSSSGRDSSTNISGTKRRRTKKPLPLLLGTSSSGLGGAASALSNVDSEASQSGSSTTDYFSNKSSPEIMSASVATYRGTPIEVSSPTWSNRVSMIDGRSRLSSHSTEQGYLDVAKTLQAPKTRMPLDRRMTSPPGAPIFQVSPMFTTEREVPSRRFGHTRVRSASLQSFEKVPTGNVRKLLVRRSGSYMSRAGDDHSVPQKSSTQIETSSLPLEPESLAADGTLSFPIERYGAKMFPQETWPSSSPTRPRSRFEDHIDFAAGSTPISVRKQRPTLSSSKTTPHKTTDRYPAKPKDKLEARISSILTHIPADILLQPSDATTHPLPNRPRNISNPKTPLRRSLTPKILRSKSSNPSPSQSLAPDPKTTSSTEIKLYHLHDSSSQDSAPVKLYVRLVGEAGERVMVRVGGGWADLGEYLRDYAQHHGKRSSISAHPFEIKNLPASTSNSRPATPASSGSETRRRRAGIEITTVLSILVHNKRRFRVSLPNGHEPSGAED
ncbi:MAG: hypothetical protein Q9164_006709 [Protoblastenia rupestris]